MNVILCLAVITIGIVLLMMNSNIKQLKSENSQLKKQIKQLWTFFQQRQESNPTESSYPPESPLFQRSEDTYYPPPPVYIQPPPPPPPRTSVNSMPVSTPTAAESAPPPRPEPPPAPVVPARESSPPAAPVAVASASTPAVKAAGPGRMESWFGRNVLGVAASILFFIGLIVFAVWIYNDIPDAVKVILMYFISAGVTVTGIVLTVRRRNNFTLILSGCGCGLLFISILLTHVYFGMLNDIATFALLLVWMIAALALSRQMNSMFISLIAHIGMGVSLCFAFAAGLRDDKLITLLVYQAASIVIIVVGNMICCRKTYRFGLFLSVIMTLVASSFMTARFVGASPLEAGAFPLTSLPDGLVAASFLAQFLCVSFLSYLLAVSTTRLESSGARLGIHIANKALWAAALCSNVLAVSFRITYAYCTNTQFRFVIALGVMAVVGSVLLLLHALLSIFMSTKLGFDGRLETLSVLLAGGLSACLLVNVYINSLQAQTLALRLPWLLLPAGLLLLAGLLGKNRAYCLGANILLGCDWLLMALFGFQDLTLFGTVALPLAYTMLYIGLAWLQWVLKPPEIKKSASNALRIFTYFFVQATALIILFQSHYEYRSVWLLLGLTLFNLLLSFFRYDRGERPALTYCMRSVEGLLLTVNAIVIAFLPHNGTLGTALSVILTVFTIVFAFYRVPVTLGQSSMAEDVCTGVKFTVLPLAILQGYTSLFAGGHYVTLAALVTILLCVIAGYARKSFGLVRYGIIAALSCMLILLNADILSNDRSYRLIVLLGGSLLFFAIQLLYNRFDEKKGATLSVLIRVTQHLTLAASALVIAFMPHTGSVETAFSVLLAVFTVIYAFYRVPVTLGQSSMAEDVIAGVAFTLLPLAILQGFTPLFSGGHYIALAALFTTLPCLAAGYARKSLGLVRYGLIAALSCMFILLNVELIFSDRLTRLIILLGGSLLFFAIQQLYNRFDDKTEASLRVLIRLTQHLSLAASAIVIAFSPHTGPVETSLSILLTAVSFAWAFLWTPKTLGRASPAEDVLEGIKLGVLILATVNGYTDWFANAYVLSLVCMLTSLACVIAGFIRRTGSLRLYGLVLTMVCVLKLVTWDVAGLESLLRILSLIGGGIICFVISAIYSYSVKHLTASWKTAEKAAVSYPEDSPTE